MILMLDLNRYLMCGLAEIFNSIVLSLPDRTLCPPDIIVGNRGDDIDVNIPKKNWQKTQHKSCKFATSICKHATNKYGIVFRNPLTFATVTVVVT